MSYILKAQTKEGERYFMNILCITSQPERAKRYKTEEDAQKDKSNFRRLFYYEEIEPTIAEYKGER